MTKKPICSSLNVKSSKAPKLSQLSGSCLEYTRTNEIPTPRNDGIHWRLIDAWATEAICDGDTHWMFDPSREKYVLYGRTKKTLPEVQAAWSKYDWYEDYHSGRAVARLESADFLNWDFTEPAAAPVVMTADINDHPGTEIYSMMVFLYENLYIGLVYVTATK